MLSKSEEEYTAALELIKSNTDSIIQTIKYMIDDSCVEVHVPFYQIDGTYFI